MSAARYDLTIEQGATFNQTFTWQDSAGVPVDVTAYTAKMQIRASVRAPDALVTLTDGDGITLGGVAGTVTVRIGADVTTDLTWRTGVYDLELTRSDDTTEVVRLVEGKVLVTAEVTR